MGEIGFCRLDPVMSQRACVACWLLFLTLFSSTQYVSGHAAMIIPTSRNSFDRVLEGFENGTTRSTPCTCANNGPCDMGAARFKKQERQRMKTKRQRQNREKT